MKRVLFLLFVAILAGQVRANSFQTTSNGWWYAIIDEENHYVSLSRVSSNYAPYQGVDIPRTVTDSKNNKYTVIEISDGAFGGCSNIKKITIYNNITRIGDGAFSGCTSLESITFGGGNGGGLTSIGQNAFKDCSALKSIAIPNSVTSIGQNAFIGCSSLKYKEYNNAYYLGNDENQYYALIKTKTTNITAITINNNCVVIADAFRDCVGLKSVTIPNSVKSISESAFNGCTGLTSITFGSGVTNIGNYAFKDCGALKSITIPNSVTSIGDYAFNGCNKLTSITIPNSVTNIGQYAFSDCNGLISVNIGNMVTSIGQHAFNNCSGLTSITIPNSVTSIGQGALSGCSSLESITLPFVGGYKPDMSDYNMRPFGYIFGTDSYDGGTATIQTNGPTTIGTTYYIPSLLNSVTVTGNYNIPGGAFSQCSGLTSIVFPNITRIDAFAFYGCSGLTTITIPDSVTKIYYGAFQDCTNLESVEFNANECEVSFPSHPVFSGCTKLSTFTFGNNVKYIHNYLLEGCTGGITSIIIPNSVTIINEGAFSGCSNLTDISVENRNTNYYSEDGVLFNYDKTTLVCYPRSKTGSYIIIPNTVTRIGRAAFCGCSNLTSITIPNSATSIGNSAFSGCSGLTSLVYDGTSEPTIALDAFKYVNSSVKVCVPEDYSSTSFGEFSVYKGHSKVTDLSVPPTCTETGLTEGVHCSNCGRVFVAQDVIPANHTEVVDNAIAPTCTESGLTEGKHCMVCGVVTMAQEVIPACHTEVTDVAVAATCTATGLTEGKHCSVCGEVLVAQTETPIIAHTIVTDAAVAATATKTGLTAGSHCSVCGAVIVAQKVVPALGEQGGENGGNNNGNQNGGQNGNEGGENNNPPTVVSETAVNAINIYAIDRTIVVENATEEIRVYDAMGRLVCRDVACRVRAELQVNTTGVYIVKVGNVVKRLMVN